MTETTDQRLQQIQALQFNNRAAAERLLLDFVRALFPDLDAVAVELRPLAVSLNSFNGFLTLADGRRLFFKTHVEPDSVIGEYYNAQLLAESGYPVIKPVRVSTEYGKQFLIYDLIDSPSVFDMVRTVERSEGHDQYDQRGRYALTEAQHQADDTLLEIYKRTLLWQSADEAAQAPIHQLFHHRLGARYEQFYAGKPFELPGGLSLPWETLCQRAWVINGLFYGETLETLIERARQTLKPAAGWSIIGHGDAHNGNVFFTPNGLVYFDPAFGGRHHPVLDLTKPLFHNVFATWMYHPQEVAAALRMTCRDDGKVIHVEHNYGLSALRLMFLNSKRNRVLDPLIQHMQHTAPSLDAWVAQNYQWRALLDSALLCCPLLTMNLADRNRFPPEIGLLGLTYVVRSRELIEAYAAD